MLIILLLSAVFATSFLFTIDFVYHCLSLVVVEFSIDSETGLITLASSLDYETPPNDYDLIITVTDHGTPALTSTADVRINVTDINDNPPTIDPPIVVKDYYIPEVIESL